MKYENQIHENLKKRLESEGVFWNLVEDRPSANEKMGKFGYGPAFYDTDTCQIADDSLEKVLFTYIEADLRAQLYRSLPIQKFSRDGGVFGLRPLRVNQDGELIDPIIICPGNKYASVNPEWSAAKKEWGFSLRPGVIFGSKNLTQLIDFLFREVEGPDNKLCLRRAFSICRAWSVRPELGKRFLFDVVPPVED